MADLRELRNKYRNLKSDFEREMEIEFTKRSAVLQSEIDREVWRLRYEATPRLSIAKIGEQYGTKNYGTIKEILDRRPTQVETDDADLNPNAATVTKEGDTYTIENGGDKVRFQWLDGYPFFVTSDSFFNASGPIATELRKENNAYAAQIEAI